MGVNKLSAKVIFSFIIFLSELLLDHLYRFIQNVSIISS